MIRSLRRQGASTAVLAVALVTVACGTTKEGDSDDRPVMVSESDVPADICGVPFEASLLFPFVRGERELEEVYLQQPPFLDCQAETEVGYLFRLMVSEDTLDTSLADVEGRLPVNFSAASERDVAGAQALVQNLSSVLYVECPGFGDEEGLMVTFEYGWDELDGVREPREKFLRLLEDVVAHVRDDYGCAAD